MPSLGGKGAGLTRLREAGFAVPPFVVVPVAEYHAFVADHDLAGVIDAALAAGESDAETSARIRAAFEVTPCGEQRARLTDLIGDLANSAVAVRSSATAEDLPEASFAGQQDTFLDVRGLEGMLAAIVRCWSSLWTERAIAYRRRNDVPNSGLGVAVVVQETVAAEVSGVVFTADPLTGRRDRLVVDSVAGPGEELVSGRVTPDHDEIDADGTVRRTPAGPVPVLTREVLDDLAATCRRVAATFGSPQDIEFTVVGSRIALVQSRPITSLYPVPEGPSEAWYLGLGSVQGMLEPLTPLGRDLLAGFAAGAATLFGRQVDPRTNPFVVSAGERLWLRLDRLLAGAARPIVERVLPVADPLAAAIVAALSEERAASEQAAGVAGEEPADGASRREVASLAARVVVPRVPDVVRNLARPERARARLATRAEEFVDEVGAGLGAAARVEDPRARLAARLQVIDGTVSRGLAVMFPAFLPVIGPCLAMLTRLRALAARTGLDEAEALALSVIRAVPGNVTTQMDLALDAASRRIAADPVSRAAFAGDPADVAAEYRAGRLPAVSAEALTTFLGAYGMRGSPRSTRGSRVGASAPRSSSG